MLQVLDAHQVRCTASLSLSVLYHFPEIADAMLSRDWNFMSPGFYNTEYMTTFDEARERAFLEDNIGTFRRHTGRSLKGFFGPSASSTERTPDLLTIRLSLLLRFHARRSADAATGEVGRLISMPYTMDINDGALLRTYGDSDYFVQVCKAQFDQLYEESGELGRQTCLALHPCWAGQPHRVRALGSVLDYILRHDGVWQTTADEIAEHFLANHYDVVAKHTARLNAVAGVADGSAKRDYGMDHAHYRWSPIIDREPLNWPRSARVAFCVIINLECLDWISSGRKLSGASSVHASRSNPAAASGFVDHGDPGIRASGRRFPAVGFVGKVRHSPDREHGCADCLPLSLSRPLLPRSRLRDHRPWARR